MLPAANQPLPPPGLGPGIQNAEPLSPEQRAREQRRSECQRLDDSLSGRFIALDPSGYFLIRVDHQAGELVAEHYSNSIDARGLATDPDTGEVLACRGGGPRRPLATYRGRSAKELGIALSEGEGPHPLSRLDHALYLGRELQKAEQALIEATEYVQD